MEGTNATPPLTRQMLAGTPRAAPRTNSGILSAHAPRSKVTSVEKVKPVPCRSVCGALPPATIRIAFPLKAA